MNTYFEPVTILPTPGRFLLNAAVNICRVSGRGLGLWRAVHHGSTIYRSWRACPTIGPDGAPFWIDLRDTQFSWLISGWRTAALESALAGLPPDAVGLDIGANIGTTARLLAFRFAKGHIYAFEPSPDNYCQLARNCASVANITCNQMALGRNTGEVSFSTAATSPDLRRIMPKGANTISVTSMRLSDWIAQSGLSRLDFIKIDVEGFEEDVLVPAIDTLKELRPWIVFEFLASFAKERSFYHGERLFPLLESLNYSVYRLDQCSGRHLKFDEVGVSMTNDYLAIPSRN